MRADSCDGSCCARASPAPSSRWTSQMLTGRAAASCWVVLGCAVQDTVRSARSGGRLGAAFLGWWWSAKTGGCPSRIVAGARSRDDARLRSRLRGSPPAIRLSWREDGKTRRHAPDYLPHGRRDGSGDRARADDQSRQTRRSSRYCPGVRERWLFLPAAGAVDPVLAANGALAGYPHPAASTRRVQRGWGSCLPARPRCSRVPGLPVSARRAASAVSPAVDRDAGH